MAGINFELKLSPTLDLNKIRTLLTELGNSMSKYGENINLLDEQKIKSEFDLLDKEINQTVLNTKKMEEAFDKAIPKLEKDAYLDELQKKIKMASEELTKMRFEKEKLANAGAVNKSEYELLSNSIKTATSNLQTMKNAKKELELTGNNLSKEYIDANNEIKELSLSLSKMKTLKKEMEVSGDKSSDEYKKISQDISQADLNLKKLRDTKKELENNGGKFSQEFIKLKNDINESSVNLTKFKQQKAQALASGEVGASEFENLDEDIRKATQELKKLEAEFDNVSKGTSKLDQNMQKVSTAGSLINKAFAFNQIAQSVQMLGSAFQEYTQPFINYQKGLADFSAITGITGDALDNFGVKARNMAKEFGGNAVSQIDAMKGVLSRLGPDIAKSPEALERMTKAINTVSAASGLDATASMNALTSSLLQFDVSLDNPVEAAGEMEKMMNVLAAGAKEGAAEIPQVADAIIVAGVAAKGAKLSFEETNAAIQVMASGGKYGAEAGTALRNVLGLMQKASGPAEASMKQLGTSSKELGEILTTKGLGEAITKIRDGMNKLGTDAEKNVALMNIFGTENAAAAGILIKKADDISELTGKISGTQTAFEQANVNMNTTAARIERFKATMEDAFIGTFQMLGDNVTMAINALGQLSPMIGTLAGIKQIIPDSAFDSITKNLPNTQKKLKDFFTSFKDMKIPPPNFDFNSVMKSLELNSKAGLNTIKDYGSTISKSIGSFSKTSYDSIKAFVSAMISSAIPAFSATATASTTTATASATAWGTALGPFMAFAAAAVLVGSVFYLLYTRVESFRKLIDDVVSVFSYGFERTVEVMQRVLNIIMSVGESIFTFLTAPFKIAWSVISGIIGAFSDFSSSATMATTVISALGFVFDGVLKTLSYIQAGFEGFTSSINSIIGSLSGVITKVLSGDIVGAVNELTSAGSKAGEAFNTSFTQKLQENSLDDFKKGIERDLSNGIEIKTKIDTAESVPGMLKNLDDLRSQIKPLEVKMQAGTASEDDKKLFDDLNKKAQETANKIQVVAPESVTGVKNWIDANGNLQETLEINTEKATKFAEENKKTYSNELLSQSKSYSNDLLEQSSIYDQQKQKLSQIQEQIKSAKSTEEVKKLTLAYNEQKQKMDETGKAIKEGYEKGAKAGLLTADAVQKIESQFGIAKGTAEQLKKVQEAQTQEAKSTTSSIADIANAFNEAKNAAQGSLTEQVSAYAGIKQQLNDGKISRNEYIEQEKKIRQEIIKNAKEVKNLTEAQESGQKIADSILKKEKEMTALQKANLQFENLKKRMQFQLESVEIEAEYTRLMQGREKTSLDDLAVQRRKIEVMNEEKAKLLEIYKITQNQETGKFEVGIKATAEEKGKILNELTAITNTINKESNKEIEIKSKIKFDANKVNEEVRKLELEQIQFDIEYGLKPKDALLPELEKDLEDVQSQIKDLEDKMAVEIPVSAGPLSLEDQAKMEDFNNKMTKLQTILLDKTKSVKTEQKKLYDDKYKELQESNKNELSEFESRIEREKSLTEMLANITTSTGENLALKKKEEQLQELENLKEMEVISEEEYNRRKEQIELDHQNKLNAIREATRGFTIEAERQKTLALLEEQKKRIEAERQMAEDAGDVEKVKELDKILGEVNISITEKGDLLKAYSGELQATLTNAFSNLFQGDIEKVKEPFKQLFAVLGGALKQYASALALNIIFGEVRKSSYLGIPSVFLIPAISGIVNMALNAILNPVLEGISSFSTGGRVDEPTLAIVGDASNSRAGSDTEWIFRDDQLMIIVSDAINKALESNNNHIENLSKIVVNEIENNFNGINSNLINKNDLLELVNNIEVQNIVDVTPIALQINNLVESIKTIQPYFKDNKLTYDNIKVLSDEYNKIVRVDSLYKKDIISESQYLDELQMHTVKVKSFAGGSGFLTKPTLAIVGDAGTNNPEIVLNNPQLQSIIHQASNNNNKEIVQTLNKLIDRIDRLELRAVIADVRQATDEINRENNRRKW